jgi:hypothetical protein
LGGGGGGGGGAGYQGGNGGGGGTGLAGGSGGGGGSNYCDSSLVSGCQISTAGTTAGVVITYAVVSPPTPPTGASPPLIWLPIPQDGAVYTLGQQISSYFLCGDGAGGAGLTACMDQNGRSSGNAVDTSTLGAHNFTVTARSADGRITTVTSTYEVVPRPTMSNVKARHGIVTFSVAVPAGGAIDAVETTSFRSFALGADARRPATGSIVYGRVRVVASHPGTTPVVVTLSQAGRLLFRDHRRATIRLVVYYTGSAGLPQAVAEMSLRVRR